MITTQRSYVDYIYEVRKILPQYFGFEGVGILFRDIKTNNLFSIDNREDEDDNSIIKTKEQKIANGEELTDEEKILDAERQYKKRNRHQYPNYLGITGEAFHSGEIIISNKISQSSNFVPSIDNLTHTVKDVHSLMMVPIFGHHTYNKEEEESEMKRMPVAIL